MTTTKAKKTHVRWVDPFPNENHMQMFERLARVKNMHGTPGERKR